MDPFVLAQWRLCPRYLLIFPGRTRVLWTQGRCGCIAPTSAVVINKRLSKSLRPLPVVWIRTAPVPGPETRPWHAPCRARVGAGPGQDPPGIPRPGRLARARALGPGRATVPFPKPPFPGPGAQGPPSPRPHRGRIYKIRWPRHTSPLQRSVHINTFGGYRSYQRLR